MTRSTTAALLTILLAGAGSAMASSAIAVASAHVVNATIVSAEPLLQHLSVGSADLERGYISLRGASVSSGKSTAAAFTVRVEIPSMSAVSSFSGDTVVTSSHVALTGTEASLRRSPFAYITYDGQ